MPAVKDQERAPWGTISRQDIVDAALKAIRGDGFERMTIRGLAAKLGVAPMSLYRHIRDKDDLLDEVVDELLRPAWRPPDDVSDWQVWIIEAADILRQLLVAEPAVLYVYLRHPVASPVAIERMEAMLEVLKGAGLDDEGAQHAYATVHTYTVGFAALQASRSGWKPSARRPMTGPANSRDTPLPSSSHRDCSTCLKASSGTAKRRAGSTHPEERPNVDPCPLPAGASADRGDPELHLSEERSLLVSADRADRRPRWLDRPRRHRRP